MGDAAAYCMRVIWLQYFCVGMSLWDGERMKRNSKEARNPTDPVELPYCEGLEVISASQLQQNPVVLANSAGAPSTLEPPREPQRHGPPQKCDTSFVKSGYVMLRILPNVYMQHPDVLDSAPDMAFEAEQ